VKHTAIAFSAAASTCSNLGSGDGTQS